MENNEQKRKWNWEKLRKMGILLGIGGICGVLGWVAQHYEVFFYPPPGIIP